MNIRDEVLHLARQKVGEVLKKQREESGITKYAACKAAGISMTQLLTIEDGRSNYTIDLLMAYCHGIDAYFMVSVEPRGGKHLDLDHMIGKMT